MREKTGGKFSVIFAKSSADTLFFISCTPCT